MKPVAVLRNDPDNWSNREEAVATGLLTRQYAEEWGAYLAERGCTFLDGC